MYWANFLHIYQPTDQQPDILEAVVAQSYRPLFGEFIKNKKAKITLNVNGALMELFDKYNYRDIIDDLRKLGKEKRIEFTSSAKYHAFLPFLEESEIIRQIQLNDETNKFFLGDAYQPKGFFPPEMAYAPNLANIIEDFGFEWVILDEIAYNGDVKKVDYSKIYQIKGSKLKVFFRERRISNLIMSAMVRSERSLKEAIKEDLRSGRYILTGMDGETFGHHRPGLEKMLFEIMKAKGINFITVSEISDYYPEVEEIEPVKSTWASSKADIDRNVQFLSWSDPDNVIHGWQWDFVKLALDEVRAMDTRHADFKNIRSEMDVALASDHLWWASAKPWWSLEMIEVGAYRLLGIVRAIPNISTDKLEQASALYEKIVSTAFQWQRTGRIRKLMKEQMATHRIPFKERTVGRGGAEEGVYHAFIAMMSNLEKEAGRKGEYEQSILWRDAIYKLENNLDVYDALNAVDLLRVKIPHEEIEKTIEKYKKKYFEIRGGQPEQRGA